LTIIICYYLGGKAYVLHGDRHGSILTDESIAAVALRAHRHRRRRRHDHSLAHRQVQFQIRFPLNDVSLRLTN